jgi:hypothetical protein
MCWKKKVVESPAAPKPRILLVPDNRVEEVLMLVEAKEKNPSSLVVSHRLWSFLFDILPEMGESDWILVQIGKNIDIQEKISAKN